MNNSESLLKLQPGRLALLTAGHLINDAYTGFLAPLLPLLMVKMNLSLALAGTLASVLSVSTSLLQPIYGYLSDKIARRYFIYLGPLITAAFTAAIGLAPTYGCLILILLMSGVGTAAFHPQGTVMASMVSGSRKGLGMSIFVTGGNLGHSLGPIIILPIVTVAGLQGTVLTVAPGLVISILLMKYAPALASLYTGNPKPEMQRPPPRTSLWPLTLLSCVVSTRSFIITGFSTFIPILMQGRGYALFTAGAAITVFQLSGSMGALLGGLASDRLGGKGMMLFSFLASAPLFWLFLNSSGTISFVSLGLAGVILYSSIPVNIVMAQEISPGRAGMASAFMVGFGWVVGGLLVAPLGVLSDKSGVTAALHFLALVSVVGIISILLLPREGRKVF